jgi:hypothetical protein
MRALEKLILHGISLVMQNFNNFQEETELDAGPRNKFPHRIPNSATEKTSRTRIFVRLTPNKWPISNRNTGALHLC